MNDGFTIRLATIDEIPVIVHQRHAMFAEMGVGTAESRALMDQVVPAWLREKMERGEYLGWFAVDDAGEVVAGLGLWIMEWIPGPLDLLTRRPYLMNVYTEPRCRGRGLARRLVVAALKWSKAQGYVTAGLHASDAGRPIYEALGFTPSNEMRRMLLTDIQG